MHKVENKTILEYIKQIQLSFWIKYILEINKYILCSLTRKLQITKMDIPTKLIYKFNNATDRGFYDI